MSTLWTPDGERPIPRAGPTPPPARPPSPPGEEASRPASPRTPPSPAPDEGEQLTEEEQEAELAQLRDELARIPPEAIIANHAYGLFQLAAVHLSLQPPQLAQARTAIDAFAALVEGMAGRLGDSERDLVDALAQLRLTFVQVRGGASQPDAGEPTG